MLYLGTVVERGPVDAMFKAPRHPYTQALLSAIPLPDPELQRRRKKIILTGDLPSPLSPPRGLPLRDRCPIRIDACAGERPLLALHGGATEVACLVRAASAGQGRDHPTGSNFRIA